MIYTIKEGMDEFLVIASGILRDLEAEIHLSKCNCVKFELFSYPLLPFS